MEEGTHTDEPDFELKFDFPIRLEGPVLAAVRGRCRPDPAYPEAWVSSIYYDTRSFDLLAEKINSDYLKTKVRLRWYELDDAPQGDASYIELKHRIGTRRRKLRMRSPLAPALLGETALDDPSLQAIDSMLIGAGIDAPHGLMPMLTVRYHRRRFVDPMSGARLSIDSRISVARINHRFLRATQRPRFPDSILEVKGSHRDLPRSLDIVTALGCRKSSSSKYASCTLHLQSLPTGRF